jgi:hypothetical protein
MGTRTRTTGVRRFGYGVAALVNLALAWVVNVWPGWEAVPFLTEETTEVLPLVNVSLLVGFLTSLLFIVADPPWLKALVEIVTTGIAVAVVWRTYRVFPFDFGADSSLWDPLAEGFLIFLIFLTSLALVVQVVQFLRILVRGPQADLPVDQDAP